MDFEVNKLSEDSENYYENFSEGMWRNGQSVGVSFQFQLGFIWPVNQDS